VTGLSRPEAGRGNRALVAEGFATMPRPGTYQLGGLEASKIFEADRSTLALLVVCSLGTPMSKQTLQLFELHVLVAMLHEGAETYSVPLVLALERRTGRPVAQAAVFIALKRLERKGLVSSRLEEPDEGRPRRYFKLTRQGLAAIEATRREHLRLWQGSSRLLGIRKA
jgi:DNA-binding PadR family transcriptional regulator